MTIRIGFVGTGGFAKHHAGILQGFDDVQPAAFCGTSLEKAGKLADAFGAAAYDQLEHMLDQEKLDAVYICVPPLAHGAIEHALLDRGIPFLVEKPLGLDLNVPTAVKDRVQETGLLTSVGYHFRYLDGTERLKEELQKRVVGMASGYWLGGMPRVGWWRRLDGSGGQLVEQATHIVDLMRYVLGEVTEVYSAAAQRVMHEKEEGVTVPDVETAVFKLSGGGLVTVSNTCLLPEGYRVGMNLYTDEGVLEWSPAGLKDIRRGVSTEYKHMRNAYIAENEAFLHSLRTGDRSRILSDYADGWKTQQAASAARQSAVTGQPVKLH